MPRYTFYALQLDHATTPIKLADLGSAGHQVDTTRLNPNTGGPYIEQSFIQQVAESIDFSCMALETLFDAISISAVTCLASGETYTGIKGFGRKLDACGTDATASGSVHRQVSNTKARLFPLRLTMGGNGNAVLDVQVILLSADGLAWASATVENVALPTGLIYDEAFKFHGMEFAGTQINSDMINNVTLDFGFGNVSRIFGAMQHAQDILLVKQDPTITVETEDGDLEATFPLTGTEGSHANSTIELQKRNPTTGGFHDTGESEHIVITFAGHGVPTTVFSGGGAAVGNSALGIQCTGIAGTPPLTISTGQTLSL